MAEATTASEPSEVKSPGGSSSIASASLFEDTDFEILGANAQAQQIDYVFTTHKKMKDLALSRHIVDDQVWQKQLQVPFECQLAGELPFGLKRLAANNNQQQKTESKNLESYCVPFVFSNTDASKLYALSDALQSVATMEMLRRQSSEQYTAEETYARILPLVCYGKPVEKDKRFMLQRLQVTDPDNAKLLVAEWRQQGVGFFPDTVELQISDVGTKVYNKEIKSVPFASVQTKQVVRVIVNNICAQYDVEAQIWQHIFIVSEIRLL